MMDIEKEQAMKPISEIEIKSLLPDEDVYINTDITRLKQVICNFINNARKFTQKGYIHFGYTLDNRNADSVQIFVEDTGSGIPLNQRLGKVVVLPLHYHLIEKQKISVLYILEG